MKHFLSRKKLIRIIPFILILLLAQVLFLFLLHPREAKAGWYDDSYAYRQSISFTHNADISSDRRITITADTATLISANKMQSDCDDTRFTDGNGKLLRYQLTGTCDNASTTYDVVFPSVINGSNSAYVYYGHPTAISGSDTSVSSVTSLTPSGSLSYNTEEKGQSPVLYLNLNDAEGSIFHDSSSNGKNFSSGTTAIEQWIHFAGDSIELIMGTDYGTPTGSYGIIKWESDLYTNPTIYFEANLYNTTGTTYAAVYDLSGNQISGSEVSGSGRQRSNAITLTDNTEYTLGLKVSSGQGTLYHARLIIVQSASTITATAQQIEIGKFGAASGTSYSPASYKKFYYYNSDIFSPAPTIYFEATMTVTAGTGSVRAALYEAGTSCTTQVSGSEISVSDASPTLTRSSAVTLTSGKEYMVCYRKSTPLMTGSIANSKIILTQSQASGIDKTEMTLIMNTDVISLGSTNYADHGRKISYNPDNFQNGIFSYFFECDIELYSSGDTDYFRLENDTDSTAITNSEVSYTGSQNTVRLRSSDISAYMPSETKTLVSQGKTSVQFNNYNFNYGSLIVQASDLGASNSVVRTDDCISDKCLFFNNSDNNAIYREYDNDGQFDAGSGSFSVGFWTRTKASNPASAQYLVSRYGSAGWRVYLNTSGQICFGIDTDSTWTPTDYACSDTSITDGSWHYITAVKNSTSNLSMYVDALQAGSDDSITGSSLSGTNEDFYIGSDSSSSSSGFSGFIDEFKYYQFALSSNQIKTNYVSRGAMDFVSAQAGDIQARGNISDGLVGYWKFDETSGDASDTSGNATTLTNNSTTAYSGAKFGNSGEMDGTADYFEAADNTALSVTGDLTLSAWINNDDTTGTQSVLGKWDGTNNSYLLTLEGDELRMYIDSSSNYQTTTVSNLSSNTFTHVAGTYNATTRTVKLFVNGTEQTSTTTGTIPTSIGDDAGEIVVGADDSPANYFDGHIDEARIYNRALSPAEVQQLYNWAPGPVGYWKMDEGTGTNAYDASINNNTGTLTNSPMWSTGKYGKGGTFSGSNQHVIVSDDDILDFADDADMSISTWFKHAAVSSQEVILSKFNEAGYKIIMESDGDITCALDYDSTWTPTDSITSTAATYDDNNWHYISCVKSGASSLSLYIDGILIGADSSITATNTLTNSDPIYFGIDADGSSNDFTGSLDDMRIYNYARTPAQIIQDMNAGHPLVGTPVAGPVAHWSFDEGALNTCSGGSNDYCDTTPNANDLAFSTTSGGYSNDGKFGKAFYGGDNRRASRTDDSDFDFSNGTDDFSISAWFNRNAVSNQEYLVDKHSTNDGFTLYMDSDGDIVCGIGDGTSFPEDTAGTSGANYDNSLWHHAVCVKSGTSSLTLYIDGKQVAQDASLGANGDMSNSGDLYIGDANATDGTDEWLGLIDEVKIYRVALTASDVQLEYNQGKAIVLGALSTSSDGITASNSASRAYCVPGDTSTCSPPVGHWKMDEKSGTSAFDTSGNGRTATLAYGASWSTGKISAGIRLDGSNDEIQTNVASSNFITNSAGTFSIWYKPEGAAVSNASSYNGDLIMGDTNSNFGIYRTNKTTSCADSTTGDRIYIYNFDVNEDCTGFTYSVGEWIYITWVHSGGSIYAYKNGILTGSTASGNTSSLAFYLNFGSIGFTNWLQGTVDHAAIYNYARTPAQIAWDYNRGAPAVWYKFDECSGTTATDLSPKSDRGITRYDATIYPAASGNTAVGTCSSNNSVHMWNDGTVGKYSSSLGFDGTDDYVATGNISPLAASGSTTTNLSWGGWVLASSSAVSKHIIHKQNEFQLITDSNSKPNCNIYYSSAFQTRAVASSALGTSTWTHLLCTYDGSNVKLYVNGKLDNTSSTTDSITTTDTTALNIGRNSTGANFFQGLLDDIRVYTYPLTAVQTRTLYNENAAVRYGP